MIAGAYLSADHEVPVLSVCLWSVVHAGGHSTFCSLFLYKELLLIYPTADLQSYQTCSYRSLASQPEVGKTEKYRILNFQSRTFDRDEDLHL